MIVPSMTNLEVYNELVADLPKLKIRANTLMTKVVKEFRRSAASRPGKAMGIPIRNPETNT